jgi:hypothetical protein
MMSAEDIAKELSCSKSHAYKIVTELNKELAGQGYITMAGCIPRAFWTAEEYQRFIKTIELGTRYYLIFEILFLKQEIKDFVDGHYGMPDDERLFPIVQEAV